MSDDFGIPGYLLWRAANLWQKRVRAVLAPFDVTPVQYLLLAGQTGRSCAVLPKRPDDDLAGPAGFAESGFGRPAGA